jgi:hypothetical protein
MNAETQRSSNCMACFSASARMMTSRAVEGVVDLRTLVMTRGLSFPLSDLASRLKCPACASRKMRLIYSVPGKPHAAEASRRNYG